MNSQEQTELELSFILKTTRQQNGGVPLTRVAEIIKQEFQPEEVEALKKEL